LLLGRTGTTSLTAAEEEEAMRLATEWVEFRTGDTRCRAYRAAPDPGGVPTADGTRLPAVVLVQEIWGVDEHIRDLAERLAGAGYLVLAPDLYSLGGARPAALLAPRVAAAKAFLDTIPPSSWWDEAARTEALSELPAEEGEAIAATFAALFAPRDRQESVAVLRDAVRHLRADARCTGRVGSVGFCMGGGLSAQLACAEPELAAAVTFYGASPARTDLAGLACPVLGFYGGEDPRITTTVPELADAMGAAGKRYEWHVYAGAPHAFFNDSRRSYHADAARDAWARLLGFFAGHLAEVSREDGRVGE
jgi:carboxymethylenebutenolidase